jgi:isoleucyl-tRNA synthetase
VHVGADDVIVTQTPRVGGAVATDAGETVAIDIAVSPELRREGLAREFVRLVQDARKSDGLEVTDRIWLRWSSSDPEVAEALTEHAGLIAGEVLALDYGLGTPAAEGGDAGSAGGAARAAFEHSDAELALTFWLGRM